MGDDAARSIDEAMARTRAATRRLLPTPSSDAGHDAASAIDRGEAALRTGRLAAARQAFADARAGAADLSVEDRARLAIGLGGLWVNEVRLTDERAGLLGFLRATLAELPPSAAGERIRLEARLAAEEYYDGGSAQAVRAALDAARRLGDPVALAEVLSLTHHVLLAPDHLDERLALADELLEVASAAGLGHLVAMALCWRTVDLFHLGDPRARRSLEELRLRADQLDVACLRYIAEVMDVMLRIRAGDLDEAERLAAACVEFGTEVGDLDAVGYYGGHIVSIRWLQGRPREVLELVESLTAVPTIAAADWIYVAVEAHMAAEAGELDLCRSAVGRIRAHGLTEMRHWSTWLAMMTSLVEAVRHIDDVETAATAYELLTPFAELPAVPSLAITDMGAVHRSLGVAAAVTGDLDAAVGHLERAIERNERLGHRPAVLLAEADLAEVLLRRGGDDEVRRAEDLLRGVVDRAPGLGMERRVPTWEALLGAPAATPLVDEADVAEFRRQGTNWIVAWRDETATVVDSVGMGYLHQLLREPGRPFHVVDLAGGASADGSDQPVLDDAALTAYRRRMEALATDIEEAERQGWDADADELRREFGALAEEVERSTGLGGRARRFADTGERARTSVRKAIVRAIERIGRDAPTIAALLDRSVSTGFECEYRPDGDAPTHWR